MRLKKKLKQHSFTTYIKRVRETVENQWPDRLLKIFDRAGNPAAICLISPDLSKDSESALHRLFKECPRLDASLAPGSISATIKNDAHVGAKLALLKKDIYQESNEKNSLSRDRESFKIDLGVVSSEADQSRVPYAVLLIHIDAHDVSSNAALSIKLVADICSREFEVDYSIYVYGHSSYGRGRVCLSDVLAIILPSTGLKRARQLAEKMRMCMEFSCETERSSKTTLSIGVGASSFGSKLSQGEFMVQIEESLDAASQLGNSVRWNVGGYRETCQVTAEERKQLFSW